MLYPIQHYRFCYILSVFVTFVFIIYFVIFSVVICFMGFDPFVWFAFAAIFPCAVFASALRLRVLPHSSNVLCFGFSLRHLPMPSFPFPILFIYI